MAQNCLKLMKHSTNGPNIRRTAASYFRATGQLQSSPCQALLPHCQLEIDPNTHLPSVAPYQRSGATSFAFCNSKQRYKNNMGARSFLILNFLMAKEDAIQIIDSRLTHRTIPFPPRINFPTDSFSQECHQ